MSIENRHSGSRIRRLLDTIRGRRNNQVEGGDKPVETPPLPFLPAQRPRPLTPTGSQDQNVIATLGTLDTLPPEIRRLVLIAAFGGRTLHLDLRLAHPRRADYVSGRAEYQHGLGSAPLSRCNVPDYSAPKTWRWYSCVCHCLIPPGSVWERHSMARGMATYRYPHDDGCLSGEAIYCELWPGKCTVGVMGWLLVCRQAYAAGIDVLYSTNTFFIESPALFDALFCPARRTNQLLLPQSLASITSLELRWDVLLFGRLRGPRGDPQAHLADEGRAQVTAHLSYLGDGFPNLRTLVLSFSDTLYNNSQVRPAQVLNEIDCVLLRSIADAVARLPSRVQQHHVVVELPSNVFRDLNGDGGAPGLALEVEERGQEWGHGKGVWLRYPLSAPSTVHPGEGKRVEDKTGGGIDQSLFYYIKEGAESDLYWGHDGNARSLAFDLHGRGHMTGYL